MKQALVIFLLSALIIPFTFPLAQAEADPPETTRGLLTPFSNIQDIESPLSGTDEGTTRAFSEDIEFIDQDLLTGWMPWIIKQLSILIGGVSVLVFSYAGVNIIIQGDNPEEVSKSQKTLIWSTVGVAVAVLSFSIVSNLFALFA